MGTRADHPAVTAFRRSQRGQAFTELALVLCLFFLVITAVLQVVWIGSAQVRCQWAARRAAWLYQARNGADPDGLGARQLQAILPGGRGSPVGPYSQEGGAAYEVHYTVPALGFFRLAQPSGFRVRARSAVIAYNERPVCARGWEALKLWVVEQLQDRR